MGTWAETSKDTLSWSGLAPGLSLVAEPGARAALSFIFGFKSSCQIQTIRDWNKVDTRGDY